MASEPRITIRLSPARADLLARNIDGWLDAGACEDGLTEAENDALSSAYQQIMKQLLKLKERGISVEDPPGGAAEEGPAR